MRLSPELILQSYCAGFFPMAHDGKIEWFSPDPRAILEHDRFRVPRSLRKVIERGVFEVRLNSTFREVMLACSDRDEGTWINDEILENYCELHSLGLAHSVETWKDGRLAGGLYGVALGGAFFGESMFHRVTDASKVALAWLMQHTRERNFTLIDTQWITPHLSLFGAHEIPRNEYLRRLRNALRLPARFTDDGPSAVLTVHGE